MKTSRFSILTVAALALAAFAGTAVAAPDILAQAWAVLTDPVAIGAVLAWGPMVRNLQAQHTAEVDGMTKIAAILNERDLTAEEQAQYDGHKAKAASLKARVNTAMEAEAASAGLAPIEPGAGNQGGGRSEGSVTLPAGARIETQENGDADPQRGFRTMGDFLMSVRGAAVNVRTGVSMDRRLAALYRGEPQAAAPSTYGNEGTGADGGFLVPPSYSQRIFQLSLEEQALLPMTDDLPVEGNGMSLPKDETTPWGANGVRAYWQNEAGAGTQTKPVFGRTDFRLKKLLALVPVTEELLADATALGAYFQGAAARSIRWKTDEAICYGNGAGQPPGRVQQPGGHHRGQGCWPADRHAVDHQPGQHDQPAARRQLRQRGLDAEQRRSARAVHADARQLPDLPARRQPGRWPAGLALRHAAGPPHRGHAARQELQLAGRRDAGRLAAVPVDHQGRRHPDGDVDAPVLRRRRDRVPLHLPGGRCAEAGRADLAGQRQRHDVAVHPARRPLIVCNTEPTERNLNHELECSP
jgi:HK97 family phage major capsid protein